MALKLTKVNQRLTPNAVIEKGIQTSLAFYHMFDDRLIMRLLISQLQSMFAFNLAWQSVCHDQGKERGSERSSMQWRVCKIYDAFSGAQAPF